MSTDLIQATLKALPYFARLRRELSEEVRACASLHEYANGQVIIEQGAECTAFFAVAEGLVRLYRSQPGGSEQVLHHIGPGRAFAEAVVLAGSDYPANASSVARLTRLVRIDARQFRELLQAEPELSNSMLAALCIHMHGLVERVEQLSLPGLSARLAHYLMHSPAFRRGEELVVKYPVTKKLLAGELATTPENLSRVLRRFHESGLIESHRDHAVLLDAPGLVAEAQGEQAPEGSSSC